MPKYFVSITIPSSVLYEVEAQDKTEAEEKALELYEEAGSDGDLNMETHFDSPEVTSIREDDE